MEHTLNMTTYTRALFKIGEIMRLWDRRELILQPKFQRRAAWEDDARSYLIDTVVRRLPMPKIYLRRTVNKDTGLTAYEVVDGQQRLRAIIDFRKGNLALRKRHNKDFGDATFKDLPDPTQREFMEYEISTELIEDASDPEIWSMFERLNTYTLTLNRQEKLNARWFGHFKQAAYQLAAEESALNAWQQLRVFSDRQIARMKEVEMTSDILVAIVRGISDINEIAKAYKDFNPEFPMKESAMTTFRTTLSFVTEHLSEAVKTTRFRRLAWFYSLMVATADAKVGIHNGDGPCELQPGAELRRRMMNIHEVLNQKEPPEGIADLHATLSQSTSHVRERKIRHDHFFKMLTLPKPIWRDRWAQLTTA
jgi:hypothetical protein